MSRRFGLAVPLAVQVAKGMKKISYRGYRFPPEIIQQTIWLYLRFTLSYRDVVGKSRTRQVTLDDRQILTEPIEFTQMPLDSEALVLRQDLLAEPGSSFGAT